MRNPENNLAEYKFLLLPILLIVAIFSTSLVFLKPKISEILEIQKKISQDRKKLTLMTPKVAALEGLNEVELSAKAELSLKALPSEKDIPNILLTLKTLGSQAGINLKQIQVDPGKLSPVEEMPPLTFSLMVEGEEEKIRTFLERAELTFPLMKVEKISISAQGESPDEASLSLNVFFLPLPQTFGAVESSLPVISPQEDEAYQLLSKFKPVLSDESYFTVQTGKENPFAF